MHPFHRTELLVGGDGFARLREARFAVIGLGGIGSYAAEALARSSVGHLTLVDFDRVCVTNLNRQLHATRKTVGEPKASLMEERVKAIHPKIDVRAIPQFYCEERADEILDRPFDFVLDCIDNMTAKVHLLGRCQSTGQKVISAMGAGGRLDPTRVRVTSLDLVEGDPFARLLRKLLRRGGHPTDLTCVWSDEPPNDLDQAAQAAFKCICPDKDANEVHGCESRFQIQGSVAFVPPVFGMTMAAVAVNRVVGKDVSDGRARPSKHRTPRSVGPASERRRELLDDLADGDALSEH